MRILLEYMQTADAYLWHYNEFCDVTWHHEPNTCGWNTIADTDLDTAIRFCNMVDIILGNRIGTKPSVSAIKKAWELFSDIKNNKQILANSAKTCKEGGEE